MSNYLFEGDYKRKPVQSLGGRSRHAETRDITLQRAQEERQRRENERIKAQAILILQSGIRGMRERRRINAELRQEFHDSLKSNYSNDELHRQMMRLNHFFKPSIDLHTLGELGKAMLAAKDVLIENMLRDERSMFRLVSILEKSLTILSDPLHASRSTMLRLLDTFTDWSEMERAKQSSSVNIDASRIEEVISIIWTYLVLQKDFFKQYRTFLEAKFTVYNWDEAQSALQHFDYGIFYQRFLEAMRKISGRNRSVNIAKTVYSPSTLTLELLVKLGESMIREVNFPLPKRGERNNASTFRDRNKVVEYIIMQRVAKHIEMEANGMCLWTDVWSSVVATMAEKRIVANNDIQTSINLRPVLYSFILLASKVNNHGPEYVFVMMRPLIAAIDNRKMLFHLPADADDEDEDEGMTEEDIKLWEENYMAETFFNDRQKVLKVLEPLLNNMRLSNWLTGPPSTTLRKWLLMYPIIGCIIEMDPKLAPVDFPFLLDLCNKPGLMRVLYLHVIDVQREDSFKEELVVFCWLLNQLMSILHDGEFSHVMPFVNNELADFVRLLNETYSDIILGDKDVNDRLQMYFKREIAQTLMGFHDRNTRIKIFPEDVFISQKFTVMFPMETHNIRFRDFYPLEGFTEPLNLLDARLLRVLIDFPFALAFHDRVSVWHQILQSDYMERHIDNPLERQNIQIRRSYLYEDSFEKLSPTNVRDIRADVRISLVNVVGAQEAGVDGGGVLREFLTEVTKAGVDPNRGLFRVDSENRIYPNPIAKRIFTDHLQHFFFMGRLVGKALYRQILLELPLASFFLQLCAFGSVSSAIDYLATLDPDLHKNLLKLKDFDGDWAELGLDFTIASEELGEARVIELKAGGKDTAVDAGNVIEYIHLVADYKINREIVNECRAFRSGLHDVVPILRIFSWKEMQTLISGSDKPINVEDWKANTNYAGGYTATHHTILIFWEVVENMDEEYLRRLLKFVTSCSRPPLLGFKDLVPKFGISNAGITDRLPTAATCMNLLKLPEFNDIETLREKLMYAINAQAGFELS